jgi:glycosyltransferase involved in cell wall biosynthesis
VHSAFDIRIFEKECRSLAQAGYQVTLVAPHLRDEEAGGVHVHAIPEARGRLSRMTRTVWRVYREAVRRPAEVYHFHDPELIPAGLLLKAKGKRVIYDIHEDVPRQILQKFYLPRWSRRPISWLAERTENTACRCFSGLVAATPAIAERFKPLNSSTLVIHNFPRVRELLPSVVGPWNQRASSVAYIGSIFPNRGVREVIAAMDLLPETLNPTLKLAGWFSPTNFQDELARLPGWRKVEFLGLLDRAGVANTLGCVRAGLVSLLPAPNHLRSIPIKLFEYMSAGVPVIASDFPLWRDIVGGAGCGLLVDPLNPQAIADAIAYVLNHPEEAETMGRRGREAVENHYNWEIEERKLLRFYAGLTGN